MEIIKIKTAAVLPPRADLAVFLSENLEVVKEGDVVFISSKVVAICEGRCLPIADVEDKDKLIEEQAEWFVPRVDHPERIVVTSIIKHTLIGSAGIDESNGNGYYILWPKDPMASAKEIHRILAEKHGIVDFGVIITDSYCLPMRTGVAGVGIGFFGFAPYYDYVGKRDIFDRPFKFSKTNIVDSLAAMANLFMGEGDELTPVLIIRDLASMYGGLIFENAADESFWIETKKDIYYPLYKNMLKGGGLSE